MTYLQLIMEQISPPRSITVTIWDNVTSHVTSISSNWSLPAYYAMVISPFILIFGDSILFFTVYLAKAHRRSLTRSIKRATKQPSQSRKASCRVNSHGQSLELSVCPSGPNRCIRVMCALGTGTVYRYIYIDAFFPHYPFLHSFLHFQTSIFGSCLLVSKTGSQASHVKRGFQWWTMEALGNLERPQKCWEFPWLLVADPGKDA